MQLLWIGCLESDTEFINKGKKGYNLASAQVSQKNILEGIEKVTGLTFDSINGCVAPHYPIYNDKNIQEVEWCHAVSAYDVSVGFKNIKYINRLTCKNSMIAAAENWVKNRWSGGELCIFVYSMRSAPMETACQIKKRIPNAKLFLIVTDIPAFMDLSQNKIKAFLKRIDGVRIKFLMKSFSGYVLYAHKMAEYLHLNKDQWMLMEGLYDIKEKINVEYVNKKKAIMYSGNTELKYGLDLLIDAFAKIADPDVELWITGGGSGDGFIKQCAEKDSRIKFFGFLPSRCDVLLKQKQASFLINMRLPTEEASAYCFPSKLLEYMASGTPVLSFRLEGIPDEYYPYLIPIPSVDVNEIRKVMEDSLHMDEGMVNDIGQKAMKFIMDEKNILSQCQRIVQFALQRGDFTR